MQVLQRDQTVNGQEWSPFDQLFGLRDELNRLLRNDWQEWPRTREFFNGWVPAVDVYEDNDSFIVRADLAGMKKEEIEIELHADALSIGGERKVEPKDQSAEIYRSERLAGRFHRTITLPKPVSPDKVSASYQGGILTVTLPKAEEAKPRQIEVN